MKRNSRNGQRTPSEEREADPFLPERNLTAWADRNAKPSERKAKASKRSAKASSGPPRKPFPTRETLLPRWQREEFFLKKRNIVIAAAFALLAALILPFLIYLFISDAFRAPPSVTVPPPSGFRETLRVAADRDCEPFSYIDENGMQGLDVDLIYRLGELLEMNVELYLMDWGDARAKLLNREIDAVLNMELQVVQADDRLIASIPTSEKQYVVYGRRKVSRLGQLYGSKVASPLLFPELGLEHEITYVSSYREMFRGVEGKKFDFLLCPIQVGNVILKKLNIRDLTPSYAVKYMYGCIAMTPNNDKLRARINEALEQLQSDGTIAELDRKWISHRYERVTFSGIVENYPLIPRFLTINVMVVISLCAYMMIQRRRLLEKDAYTKELQRSYALIDQQNARLEEQQVELSEAKAKTEAANASKSRFLSNMSHDLRTPMNAVLGFTALALENLEYRETVRGYLDKVMTAGKNLLGMINDILEMSRIENGRLQLEPAPCSLNRLLRDVYTIAQAQAAEKGIRFSASASNLKQEQVLCDKMRLNQALINLLSNAVKFTPIGGNVTLTLTQKPCSRDGYGAYEWSVKDTGIGMSAEFAKRAFEPFERERNTTESGVSGAGLGLSIAKNLVDMMGGTIRVITEPGRGAEFIIAVEFPLQADQQVEVIDGKQILERSLKSLSADGKATGGESLAGFHILLAEDNAVNREIAVTLLTMCDATVDTAEDGAIAVKKVKASPPETYDLILMDLQMPVMDGIEAAKAIRALENPMKASVPIVAMSANAFEEDKQEAYRAGMNGHISKPIDMEKLIKVLRKFYLAQHPDAGETSDNADKQPITA